MPSLLDPAPLFRVPEPPPYCWRPDCWVSRSASGLELPRLRSLPEHAFDTALILAMIETIGVEAVRKISGYHDEPLHGHRAGQRSIRLSRQWRAIYAVQSDAQIEFIEVQEVNPHDY